MILYWLIAGGLGMILIGGKTLAHNIVTPVHKDMDIVSIELVWAVAFLGIILLGGFSLFFSLLLRVSVIYRILKYKIYRKWKRLKN